MTRLTKFAATALLLLVAVALSPACGDDDDAEGGGETASPTTTPTPEPIDISVVPELADGTLTLGSIINLPPMEFYRSRSPDAAGLDVDIIDAIAVVLGISYEFQEAADYTALIGDLKASRYDAAVSAITITSGRTQDAGFLPYFGPAGTSILVGAGNPEGITAFEDLCGNSIAAQLGTAQIVHLNDLNRGECAAAPIDIKGYSDNPSAIEELVLGRVVAQLSSDPVAVYAAAESGGVLEVAVSGFDSAPYGIAVRKDSPELLTVLSRALALIQADGTYERILRDWGLEDFPYGD